MVVGYFVHPSSLKDVLREDYLPRGALRMRRRDYRDLLIPTPLRDRLIIRTINSIKISY